MQVEIRTRSIGGSSRVSSSTQSFQKVGRRREKGNQKVKQGQRIVSMEWRRNIEDRDRLECIHIHWPTWGPHKGHPPPTPYPPTDKSAIPPAWLEHELSPLFSALAWHPGLKDESGMAPAVDMAPGHTTDSTSTLVTVDRCGLAEVWSAGFWCASECRDSRESTCHRLLSETGNDIS